MPSVTGSFTATGSSASFKPNMTARGQCVPFNFNLRGTFVGTVQLERSFDGGSNWLPLTALGSSISFTAPCSEVFEEPSANAIYRANCTSYTSGTITYGIGE